MELEKVEFTLPPCLITQHSSSSALSAVNPLFASERC